ncbi:MAG: helix-turn-helix domain-containing protein [Chloroflexi bacterium]|nr:helix-turn-helix domain-containing protein [Chloroflexota bacterium]
MAAAVSMSRSTFADWLRAATGETPMLNLTRYRMARAAEYLRGTNAGIREIARLVGYDSEVSVNAVCNDSGPSCVQAWNEGEEWNLAR